MSALADKSSVGQIGIQRLTNPKIKDYRR